MTYVMESAEAVNPARRQKYEEAVWLRRTALGMPAYPGDEAVAAEEELPSDGKADKRSTRGEDTSWTRPMRKRLQHSCKPQ